MAGSHPAPLQPWQGCWDEPLAPAEMPIPLQQPNLDLNQFIPVLVWVFALKYKADSGGV